VAVAQNSASRGFEGKPAGRWVTIAIRGPLFQHCQTKSGDHEGLITGSAGHLGVALVRTLTNLAHEVVSLDILESLFTTQVGSIMDRSCVRPACVACRRSFHAATLHKPHIATHPRQDFIDTNVTGTLNLLEEAVAAGVTSFVYTSTTSVLRRRPCATPPELLQRG